ncbi:hypothetical protein [Limimaricola sp. AA108-03]|uniref:hypothetical protein n=1 Tax=Limimaricola sp. AA108-03 TaxID=3425945 RepID=UPI003D77BF1E
MSLITTIAPCPFRAAETALRRFLLGHAEALVSAAGLLGEQPAVRRTARLLEELVDAPRLTRRLRLELVELHRLLALDRVDEPESLEAACFAKIDPASPAVEEICELTDMLRAHLIALATSEEGDPAWEEILSAA